MSLTNCLELENWPLKKNKPIFKENCNEFKYVFSIDFNILYLISNITMPLFRFVFVLLQNVSFV